MAGRHAQRRTRRTRLVHLIASALASLVVLATCTGAQSNGAPSSPVQTATKTFGGLLPRVINEPARAPYGSGEIGNWQSGSPTVSSPLRFQQMLDTNGVLIVGDSIADDTSFEFAVRMRAQHGLETAVHNWRGRPTEPAVDWIVANDHLIPPRGIVVASGANDVFSPAGWWQQVNRVIDAADGKPVYWVSTYVDRWSGSGDRRAADMRNSAWINDQLYSIARSYPNLVVVDWHAYLSQGWNETKIEAWLSDGVHPTAAGIDAWCDLLELRMGL